MHLCLADNKEYDAYYCENKITDTFMISFYTLDTKAGKYVIEIGNHIYSDEDEYAYPVSGAMEEVFLELDFDV